MENSEDLITTNVSTKENSNKKKSTKEKSTKEKSTKEKSTKEKSTKEKSTKSTKSTKVIKEENLDENLEEKSNEENEENEDLEDSNEELNQQILVDEIFQEDGSDELDDSDDAEKDNLNMNFDLIIETLTLVTDTNLKDFSLTKEFVTQLTKKVKDINKLSSKLLTNILDVYTKENLLSIKNKNSKQKKPKKVVNKENMAVNKGQKTFSEVLTFMEFDEDLLVSRAQLIQKINSFVRKEKENKNPDIFVEGDNKLFKLIGPLKDLFDFIKIKMIERGDFQESDPFPMQISYRDIMKYLKYCFYPSEKK